ncbi:MAG: hypothetical protein ACNA70_09910, partial [Brevefilum sp.]
MNIKSHIIGILIVFSLLALGLSACQADEPMVDELCPLDELSEDCPPAGSEIIEEETAYPVVEEYFIPA